MAPYPYQHLKMLCKAVTYTACEGSGGSGVNISHGSVATNRVIFLASKRLLTAKRKLSSICRCADVDQATLCYYRHLNNRWSLNNSFEKKVVKEKM